MKKVVIITGASSGIGLATAKMLMKKGFVVYGISRHPHQDDFVCYEADVNDYQRVGQIFQEVYKKEGRIDALVNNAGFGIAGAIEETKPENINAIIQTNLTAVITLSGMIIPYLKKSGGGRIVNTSSIGGLAPLPFQACYSATKSGVEVFSRALANEVKPFNIKVVSVLPGDTKTGFTASRVIDENKDSQYLQTMHRSVSKMEHDEQHGKSPEFVAKAMYKAIAKKNPPLRICVGGFGKLINFLTRIFPTRFVNFVIKCLYA